MEIKFGNHNLGEIIIPPVLSFDPQNDKVEDRIIGDLTVQNGAASFEEKTVADGSKTIVIILESPHKDEFIQSGSVFTPQKAAQGTTGENINNYIAQREWVKTLEDGVYAIQLMNAIQYQMSCYNSILLPNNIDGIDEVLRNRIFYLFWQQESIVQDFVDRLTGYTPTVIINACTGGKLPHRKPRIPEKHLNWLVQQIIPKEYESIVKHDVHPVNWNRSK